MLQERVSLHNGTSAWPYEDGSPAKWGSPICQACAGFQAQTSVVARLWTSDFVRIYRGYIRIMENNMETTIIGYISRGYRAYIAVIVDPVDQACDSVWCHVSTRGYAEDALVPIGHVDAKVVLRWQTQLAVAASSWSGGQSELPQHVH